MCESEVKYLIDTANSWQKPEVSMCLSCLEKTSPAWPEVDGEWGPFEVSSEVMSSKIM